MSMRRAVVSRAALRLSHARQLNAGTALRRTVLARPGAARFCSSSSSSGGKGDDDADHVVNVTLDMDLEAEHDGEADLAAHSGADEAGWEDAHLVPQPKDLKYPTVFAVSFPRKPLFPGIMHPVGVSDEALIESLKQIKDQGHPYIGVFLSKDPDQTELQVLQNVDDAYATGTLAHIYNVATMPGGTSMIVLQGKRRINLNDEVPSSFLGEPVEGAKEESVAAEAEPAEDQVEEDGVGGSGTKSASKPRELMRVAIDHLEDNEFDRMSDNVKAYTMETVATLKEITKNNHIFRDQLHFFSQGESTSNDPSRLADISAALTSADGEPLQKVLEQLDVEARLEQVLFLLAKEVELSKLQQKIKSQVEEKMSKQQRTYFLHEQLKSIKQELGLEKDNKEVLIQKFRDNLTGKTIPDEANTVIEEELQRLSSLEPNSSEFSVTRNYLDWLTALPWGVSTQDTLDVDKALAILDEDHYGLEDIKERILEFIAVGALKGGVQGKILCLVGPPGTGKTSIGASIARALDRKYYRFSVGGMTDVAEIKGHRRTYVGAMPGKLIQCLKQVESFNPMIMIDEIDKLGRGYQGDPSSALLELLDPEQNMSFLDHYLDVRTDLSNVLFICTANSTDTIPGPLLDRMEVMRLSGYLTEEKLRIAQDYLSTAARKSTGVPDDALVLTDDGVRALIQQYCREAGVRRLNQHVEKLYRKVALKVIREGDALEKPIVIDADNLSDYAGKPNFTKDRIYEGSEVPPGVVMGLAWTSMGGSTLYIEACVEALEGSGLKRTGQLGDVMKESSSIAYTFAKSFMIKADPNNPFFGESAIHMHVPEGGTPKDGPSAGITITTSLLSLAYGVPSNPAFAMTGELTLTGKVLPIGGVKEKVLAAKRAGVTSLIFPVDNQRDFDELPDNLKDGVSPHFVNYYQEVFDLVFDKDDLPKPVKKKAKAKRVTKAEKLALELQEASA